MAHDLTPERACEILGVTVAASSEERHRVFRERLGILEKKLGQAPTDGLKAKYRDAIRDLEQAIEALELAQTESDLGAVRPDLKSAPSQTLPGGDDAASRPAYEVGRGLRSPRSSLTPGEPPRRGTESPSHQPARRHKSQREFRLAVTGVVFVVVLIIGWFWKQQHDAAAERARQEELARQEAIARTANDEAERKAAEQKAAALRNDEDKRKELERRTRVTLAELETNFENLDQKLKELDRSISDARSAERDLAKDGGWKLEWVQRRRALLEGHRTWLADLATRHPARVRLKSATQMLQGRDVEGAAAEAQAGAGEWARHATDPDVHRYTEVGRPMIDWLVRPDRKWPDAPFEQVRVDEPASVEIAVAELKSELAYLDDKNGRPSPADWSAKMRPLCWLAGENDRDFLRWKQRFLSSVVVETVPADAIVETRTGKGGSGFVYRDVGPFTVTATVSRQGYESAKVAISADFGEEKTIHVKLEPELSRDERDARDYNEKWLGQTMDLNFIATNGERIDLAKFRGQVVLVDFWAPWCPPCRPESQKVNAILEKYQANGVRVIGVCVEGTRKQFDEFLARGKISSPQSLLEGEWKDNPYSKRFDVQLIPRVFVVDREGYIRYIEYGFVDSGELEDEVKRMLR